MADETATDTTSTQPLPSPGSWMDAGAAASGTGGTNGTSGTPAPSITQPGREAALKAAQNPEDRSLAQTAPAMAQPQVQEKPVPLALRPSRGGMLGVIDKMADALTGTTRPEIYKDDFGNEYVYHPNLSRGQQWMRIGGQLAAGAAAGLAAGRGKGPGAAGVAGVQVGQQIQQGREEQEDKMKAEVRQDTIDRFNWQKANMDLIESSLKARREGLVADRETKKFYDDEVARLTSPAYGGRIMDTATNVADLGQKMHEDPTLISGYIKEGIIRPVTTLDENMQHQITFIKMPPKYGEKLLGPGQEIDHYNSSTGKLEKQTTNQAMTQREIDIANDVAHKEQLADQTAKVKLRGETAGAEKTEEEVKELRLLAPQKLEEMKTKILHEKAETALAWTNNRKSKIEADNLEATAAGDDVESNAQALVDQRSAPSLMSKRKDYNTIMRRADELSKAQTGKPYDREAGEMGYRSRMKLVEDYTGTGGEAKNLESYDKFLGHALSASEAINGMRNTNVKLVNMPYNKLSTLAGTQRSNEVVAAQIAIGTLRTEYETMLKNNTALTVEDRKEGEAILSDSATPAQMQTAMKKMVHTGMVRMRSSDYTYSRTMHEHVPMLLSPDGERSVRHFGEDPLDVYSDNVGIAVQAPDGEIRKVPKAEAKFFLSHGGKLVEP